MRGCVCRLPLLLVLRSESRGTHDHILLSQIPDSPNLEGQVPVFISPRNRVAWLYPQALGSLLVYEMNCLLSLEHWGRGFESHSRHGCLCVRLFCVCVVLCAGGGLATG
jgi:hypothetical protein